MKNKSTIRLAFVAFFAAVICVACFIRIPVGAIPIVMQNALCILAAALLGGIWGGAPTALFLLAGLIGLPVYSGGSSGIGVWVGPTGGFFPGYLLGAVLTGLLAGRPAVSEKKLSFAVTLRLALAMLLGMIILYIPGVIHFARWALNAGRVPAEKTVFAYTMGACVLPFLPGDALKFIICLSIAVKIRPVIAQYLYAGKKAAADSAESAGSTARTASDDSTDSASESGKKSGSPAE